MLEIYFWDASYCCTSTLDIEVTMLLKWSLILDISLKRFSKVMWQFCHFLGLVQLPNQFDLIGRQSVQMRMLSQCGWLVGTVDSFDYSRCNVEVSLCALLNIVCVAVTKTIFSLSL